MIRCGIDIIEISRIKSGINKLNEKFLNRIFTINEIRYCEQKKDQKYQSYAGRFAAKEAIFKALSDLVEDKYKVQWKDFEIVNNESGKPKVNIYNENVAIKENNILKIKSMDISISHCKEYATAMCVVEIDE